MSLLMLEVTRILASLWVQIAQIGPYWAAGLIAGSLINVYVSEKIIAKVVAIQKGRFSMAALCMAAALGIASPLCMYGTVPLIASLGRKGVPEYLLACFMISSILLNPNLFIMSFVLGAPLALLRLFICILAGVIAGVLVYIFWKNKTLFRLDAFQTDQTKQKRMLLTDILKAVRITAPYFLLGILITSAYDLYFPKSTMNAVFGGNQAFGTLFAMSLSVPLYTCGGGAIPLLLAWMREGLSTGSALTFMVAGPSTKFTNLGAVKIILGGKSFALYLLYCLGFALLSGLFTDVVRTFL